MYDRLIFLTLSLLNDLSDLYDFRLSTLGSIAKMSCSSPLLLVLRLLCDVRKAAIELVFTKNRPFSIAFRYIYPVVARMTGCFRPDGKPT